MREVMPGLGRSLEGDEASIHLSLVVAPLSQPVTGLHALSHAVSKLIS